MHLLRNAFEEVYITEQVLEEFKLGVRRGVLSDVLKLSEDEIELYNSLRMKLGRGEASCLSIAKNRNMKFLTDDSDARRIANILGVPVSGTIGVLFRCIEKGMISEEEGNKLLKEMVTKGFYFPISDLNNVFVISARSV